MIKETRYSLKKLGSCDSCRKNDTIWLVYGYYRDIYSYICEKCLTLRLEIGSPNCALCNCFLLKSFRYPVDCQLKDQKHFCYLCHTSLELKDKVIDATPRKERKIQNKVFDDAEKKGEKNVS